MQNIQSLLKTSYSSITLNVTTTTNGIELKGIYKLTFEGDITTVDYSFERLNELDINGNNDGYKSTVTGVASVQNGNIVEGDTSVALPEEINFNSISFKPAFFENVTVTGAKFQADVKDCRGFTGNWDIECTDMHVEVIYSKTELSMMSITYVSKGGSNVSITYTFTK